MKSSAVLVNTSRGPVVDQAALAAALRDGVIWAAALDVTDPEPIPDGRPARRVGQLPGRAPHRVGVAATRGKMAAMAAANLLAGVRGEPLPTPVPRRARDGRSRAASSSVRGPISLRWLVVLFSVAQLLDRESALVVAREMNPIVAAMVAQPLVGVALKLALIALVVATAEICDRQRPGLARLVLIVGAIAVSSAPSATPI